MKHSIILLVFVLEFVMISSFAVVNAEELQTKAYVYITIINPLPIIENLTITNPAYYFSRITCVTDVIDNNPEAVSFDYRWYVNGELISEDNSISGIEAGKEVKCEVIAYDSIGQASNVLSDSIIIQQINVFGLTAYTIRNLNASSNLVFNASAVIISLLFLAFGLRGLIRRSNRIVKHIKI